MRQLRPDSMEDIWIIAAWRHGALDEATSGLIAEARRFLEGRGTVTAVVAEWKDEIDLSALTGCGVDRILCLRGCSAAREPESRGRAAAEVEVVAGHDILFPRGEILAEALTRLAQREKPSYIFLAHDLQAVDLAPRLAASLGAGLVTRAVDLEANRAGKPTVVRPIADGYLFERVEFLGPPPHIVSFLPSSLTAPEGHDVEGKPEIVYVKVSESPLELKSRVVSVAVPPEGEADLEDADTVVSGGRGVGKGEAFEIINELARVLGGAVGGTRPVVDWGTLPFEQQVGQTGRTVSPRLLIACGISGANEYTAGMEKSRVVIAVNSDPSARIFRFADLGVVGDLHEVLPLLIRRIKESKATP